MYWSGVRVVVWWKWMVDMDSPHGWATVTTGCGKCRRRRGFIQRPRTPQWCAEANWESSWGCGELIESTAELAVERRPGTAAVPGRPVAAKLRPGLAHARCERLLKPPPRNQTSTGRSAWLRRSAWTRSGSPRTGKPAARTGSAPAVGKSGRQRRAGECRRRRRGISHAWGTSFSRCSAHPPRCRSSSPVAPAPTLVATRATHWRTRAAG